MIKKANLNLFKDEETVLHSVKLLLLYWYVVIGNDTGVEYAFNFKHLRHSRTILLSLVLLSHAEPFQGILELAS